MKDLLQQAPKALFSAELPKDPETENHTRIVERACFSAVKTRMPSAPKLLHRSNELLSEWGVEIGNEEEFLKIMSGAKEFNNFAAYAMCYGGHQFGQWAGQLGDGRAINIAELKLNEQAITLQLKGAGPTPYSRRGDGLAVLRSSIREYLCSEAMHRLGVPTTRALALVITGDQVLRDMLYDGNQAYEPGAIVCRTAASFIRFGNFELFASRKDHETLKQLMDHTLTNHFPHLGAPSTSSYLNLFKEVVESTKTLIVHWQRVGFVHGVMNTDNLSILGLTIDYGPYGWLEDYNPDWTPNTTDAQHRRYRFGNQSQIALWNLVRLANAIYPLIEEAEPLQAILEGYKQAYQKAHHEMMCAKLGLYKAEEVSDNLIDELFSLLKQSALDYTIFFRELSAQSITSFSDGWAIVTKASYLEQQELTNSKEKWETWFKTYNECVKKEAIDIHLRKKKMKSTNPKYVLRNYMAQLAIEQAEEGNYELLDELYRLLQNPYDEQVEMQKWYAKRPEWAMNKVGCSMLSCSS